MENKYKFNSIEDYDNPHIQTKKEERSDNLFMLLAILLLPALFIIWFIERLFR